MTITEFVPEAPASRDVNVAPRTVKVLVTFEANDREERREIGRFASVAEAIATSEGLVDSFLLKHYHPKLSTC